MRLKTGRRNKLKILHNQMIKNTIFLRRGKALLKAKRLGIGLI